MNRVLISLLKGSNKKKLSLLNKNLEIKELLELISSDDFKNIYSLEKGYAFNRFDEISKIMQKVNMCFVTIADENYPENLKNIYDPPFLLYYRGDIGSLTDDLVSVVGTRKPSIRGFHEAFKLGLDLGKQNVSVVSGLAMGIDGASHSGNILGGGKTIAVLGSGVDTIYPASNRDLARDILKTGGAIISEFPPGESPKRFNFPKRNRVIAGLSRSLVIIQAPKKSGALITGEFALNNGGDVYVHSVGVADKRFLGSDKYYKDGAKKIDSAYPLLSVFDKVCQLNMFDSEDFSSSELIKMELEGNITKYKGCYFSL